MLSIAHERDLEPLIVTFEAHPRVTLHSDYIPQLLTTPTERKQLLSAYGEVLMLPFGQIQPLTAEQFMLWLHTNYNVTVLVMGYDHRFGSDRLRHVSDYRRIGKSLGIEVLTMSEYVEGEWHVSSTEIRLALENGNIAVANELLGRPYSLHGVVVHGNGVGRKIGFPTANIQPESTEKILPKNGVYVASVRTEQMEWKPAMLNIGTNPTLGNREITIEVHIPSFSGDLYGQSMDIQFLRYIREEKQFDNLSQLQKQIAEDIRSIQ